MGGCVVSCVGSPGNVLCVSRDLPTFSPPFHENITYRYAYTEDRSLKLDNKEHQTEENGYNIKYPRTVREGPKWYDVKYYENENGPALTRLYVSGRMLIQFKDDPSVINDAEGVNLFSVCLRGKPIYEKLRGFNGDPVYKFNSGIFFCIYCVNPYSGYLFLMPQIRLLNDQCKEIVLCEDIIGPITKPEQFFADFAIVDDGRNIQLDVIVRIPESKAFRSCIQDYTMFNSGVPHSRISIGYSNVHHYSPESQLYLQNLCIAELEYQDAPVAKVFDWNNAENTTTLYSGAHSPDLTVGLLPSRINHPQFMPLDEETMEKLLKESGVTGSKLSKFFSNELLTTARTKNARTNDFWHHIRYDPVKETGKLEHPNIEGEFWLSKEVMPRGQTYFQCSSTMAQAISSGIIFRFSCPADFMTLIEAGACRVLRHTHIPSNGIAFGIEEDSTDKNLLRMFVEHRSRIIEDMTICNCPRNISRENTIVHQEVFDAGDMLYYRLTVVHPDETSQTCTLRVKEESLHYLRAPPWDFSSRSGSPQMSNIEFPSPRFPISPAQGRHVLPETNRIMLYSMVPYDPKLAVRAQKEEEERCLVESSTPGGNSFISDWHTPPCITPNGGTDMEISADEGCFATACNSDAGDSMPDMKKEKMSNGSSPNSPDVHKNANNYTNGNNMTNGPVGPFDSAQSKNNKKQEPPLQNSNRPPKLNLQGIGETGESEVTTTVPEGELGSEGTAATPPLLKDDKVTPNGLITGGFLETNIPNSQRPVVWRRPFIESAAVCTTETIPFECFPRSIS